MLSPTTGAEVKTEPTVQERLISLASDQLKVRPIQQLAKDVINRIAAGEVIQRPANAIKELLENSLDAGSTQIQITLREGGLKLLQVQDNGCGIRLEDMPILCERFTTSKLRDFSELSSLCTFGFRGEALCSLSHVSLLTVTTRTAGQTCAYRLSYRNANPMGNPVPCAGNTGTTILAEDMFYNTPIRRAALRSAREECSRVAEVVSQYAIHYAPKCGFHLRSATTNSANTGGDLRTTAGWSRIDAVRTVVGSTVADNLIPFSSSQTETSEITQFAVENLGLRYEGLLTKPSQVTSGTNPALKLYLFINNRMVECNVIKRALESSYGTVLSRALQSSPGTASSPVTGRRSSASSSGLFRPAGLRALSNSTLFVYLNIQLPTENLDVNVHPTKSEVHFMHEIVRAIQDATERSLLSSAQVRSFLVRSVPLSTLNSSPSLDSSKSESTASNRSKFIRPQENIRIDAREQRLERFVSYTSIKTDPDYPSRDSSLSDSNVKSPSSPNLDDLDATDHVLPRSVGNEENRDPSSPHRDYHTPDMIESDEKVTATNIDPSESPQLTAKPVVFLTPSTICKKTEVETKSPDLLRPSSTLNHINTAPVSSLPVMPKRRRVRLHTVLSMRRRLEQQMDPEARRMLRACKFVGSVDRTCCLVQHETDLLLIRLQPLTRAFFYQLSVTNFANHGELVFSEPVPLQELIELSLSLEQNNADSDDATRAAQIVQTLSLHAPMLWDYFSIRIEPGNDGRFMLHGIPLLLDK
ncbi:DNA mismatch repair protein Mlh1 [Fasciolopsis buskii]|uniref:DNA mismatch repair protein Mlh1 n=1 Tax=Fasciolopsis buskii TaxID=27845 RepID=A0A8E0RYU6_9TREM|nr:DNA mismatch repair protein Mlh1 [Fasciolopsis buski]